MKIIQVIPHFPPFLGGMEQRVKELSERLAKNNNVGVLTSDIGCEKGKLKSTKNLTINYLKAKEYFSTPIIPSLYEELMKIPKNSILHVHIAQAYIPEIVYRVWKKRKFPYIAHIRMDVEPSSLLGKIILEPYKKIFLKKFLKHANKIIVLNKDYFHLIKDKYNIPEDKIRIIPNATNFKVAKSKTFSKNSKIKILAVGRLEQQKNYFSLIKSISLLPKDIKENIIFNIAGEGSRREELESLIKELHLERNVFLKGKVIGEDLEKLYEKSDLFILASYREGFSTTLLEAMSKGLPIITSNVLGNRYIIKENYNGYLCEIDPDSIAKIISKMIDNKKQWAKFSINNLQEIKKYSWDEIVRQTEEVYKEVLKEHNEETKTKAKY